MQLVIPAYNEEGRLPATLRALRTYALSTAELPRPPLEVLVVDNASTDRTAEVAAAMDSPVMPVRAMALTVICLLPVPWAPMSAASMKPE